MINRNVFFMSTGDIEAALDVPNDGKDTLNWLMCLKPTQTRNRVVAEVRRLVHPEEVSENPETD